MHLDVRVPNIFDNLYFLEKLGNLKSILDFSWSQINNEPSEPFTVVFPNHFNLIKRYEKIILAFKSRDKKVNLIIKRLLQMFYLVNIHKGIIHIVNS